MKTLGLSEADNTNGEEEKAENSVLGTEETSDTNGEEEETEEKPKKEIILIKSV